MALLILMGRRFGMSSNLETMCSIGGAGRFISYFNVDVKPKLWGLIVVLGTIIGGFIAANFLTEEHKVAINTKTVTKLQELGIESGGKTYLPTELFSEAALTHPKTWVILIIGGFFVGFGTRYAGGCTSGHAISGLSNLQIPSLIAVIGFFVGGLLMVHVLFPFIF